MEFSGLCYPGHSRWSNGPLGLKTPWDNKTWVSLMELDFWKNEIWATHILIIHLSDSYGICPSFCQTAACGGRQGPDLSLLGANSYPSFDYWKADVCMLLQDVWSSKTKSLENLNLLFSPFSHGLYNSCCPLYALCQIPDQSPVPGALVPPFSVVTCSDIRTRRREGFGVT